MALYFAYGSNLSLQQMRARCPNARPYGRAFLAEYALTFAGHSATWGGAVATLTPDPERETPGLLYQIDDQDLARLDGFEGHPFVYRRQRKVVQSEDGTSVVAHVYVLEGRRIAAPSDSYAQVIRDGYRRLDFDVDELTRAIRSASHEENLRLWFASKRASQPSFLSQRAFY